MNDDKIQGATRMIGGKLEDVAGGLIGDKGLQARHCQLGGWPACEA